MCLADPNEDELPSVGAESALRWSCSNKSYLNQNPGQKEGLEVMVRRAVSDSWATGTAENLELYPR